MSNPILISGGAGYIGSHAAYVLSKSGYTPIVIDNLATGHAWATKFGTFEKGDVGDEAFVRGVCVRHKPLAALHFAAFIEVGESVQNPQKYSENNFTKAARFFKTLQACGVNKIVFSSTAAVYGESGGLAPITETQTTKPINPYGQSKLDAENFLRSIDGMRSVSLRYFNVAGAAADAGIGEAHRPESHLIPRLLLPLLGLPAEILQTLNLQKGFTVYGDDYPTPDGTAIRDYIHVLDLIDAHVKALDYLLQGGSTDIFNLGSGKGFSVQEIVEAAKTILMKPDFKPPVVPRRTGDPAILVASNEKARRALQWQPTRSLAAIIHDAATWHRSGHYLTTMRN